MNFDFNEEQHFFGDHMRRFFREKCTPAVVRDVLDSDAPISVGLWQAMNDLEVLGCGIPVEYGGSEAGYLELCLLAQEVGYALAPIPFHTTRCMASELLLSCNIEDLKGRYLPELITGKSIATLSLESGSKALHLNGNKLTGYGMVPDGSVADLVFICSRNGAGSWVALARPEDFGVRQCAVQTIDPTRDLARMDFCETEVSILARGDEAARLIEAVSSRAAVLIAFEQLGGAQKALESGVAYAKDRYAFGRPIGSFQAIKHQLADVYTAIELARSNCYYAAWALSTASGELPFAATVAHLAASRAYQLSAKESMQVHGGMGFTWEFDCHLHYRRAAWLSALLGGAAAWEKRLVSELRRQRAQGGK